MPIFYHINKGINCKQILETLLIRMGCRCIVVSDGSEAISVASSDIRFDVIILDLHMPNSKRFYHQS